MDASGDDGATASAGGAANEAAAAMSTSVPSLSASVVARHFASVYYEAMSARPQFLHRFYKAGSSLSHDGSVAGPDAPPVTIDGTDGDAMAAIVAAMPLLRHPGGPVATIVELTAQYSCGGCVHVLVRGVFTLTAAVAAAGADSGGSGGVANGGLAVANGHAGVSSASSTDGESGGPVMQPFVQSFVLGPQDGGYYVHNDILNYVEGATSSTVAPPHAVAQAPAADCGSARSVAEAAEAVTSTTPAPALPAAAPTEVAEVVPPSSSSASVEAIVAPTTSQPETTVSDTGTVDTVPASADAAAPVAVDATPAADTAAAPVVAAPAPSSSSASVDAPAASSLPAVSTPVAMAAPAAAPVAPAAPAPPAPVVRGSWAAVVGRAAGGAAAASPAANTAPTARSAPTAVAKPAVPAKDGAPAGSPASAATSVDGKAVGPAAGTASAPSAAVQPPAVGATGAPSHHRTPVGASGHVGGTKATGAPPNGPAPYQCSLYVTFLGAVDVRPVFASFGRVLSFETITPGRAYVLYDSTTAPAAAISSWVAYKNATRAAATAARSEAAAATAAATTAAAAAGAPAPAPVPSPAPAPVASPYNQAIHNVQMRRPPGPYNPHYHSHHHPGVRALVQALGGRRRRRRGRAALKPLFGLDWWGFDSSARSCWAAPCGWRRRGRPVGSQAMRMIGFVDQGSRWMWSGGDSSSTASGPLLSCSVRVKPSCSQRTWWRLVSGRGVAGQGLGERPMPLGLCLVRYLRALAVPRTTLLVNGCVVVVAAVVDGRVD